MIKPVFATGTPQEHQTSETGTTNPSGLLLRVCGGKHDGKLVRLKARRCLVGSAPRCTLRLVATGIRPLECIILRGRKGTAIRRLNADTERGGHEFSDAWLGVGDRVQVGPVQLEVLADIPDQWAVHSPPPANVDDEMAAGNSALEEVENIRSELEAWQWKLAEQQQQLDDERFHLNEQKQTVEAELAESVAEQERLRAEVQDQAAKSQAELAAVREQYEAMRQDCLRWETQLAEQAETWQQQAEDDARELVCLRDELAAAREQNELLVEESTRLAESLAELQERQAQADSHPENDLPGDANASALTEELQQERLRLVESASQLATERAAWEAEFQERQEEFQRQREDWSAECDRIVAELLQRQAELDTRANQAEELSESAEVEARPQDEHSGPAADHVADQDATIPTHTSTQSRSMTPSTAEILAKFGFSVDDDEADDCHPSLDSVPASEPTRPSEPTESNLSTPMNNTATTEAESVASAHEHETSIERYMSDLLRRAGVETPPLESPQVAAPVKAREIPADDLADASVDDVSGGASTTRRSAEPAFVDLAAMRDVANLTAKSALDRHSVRQLAQHALTKWFIALMSFITGFGLLFLSDSATRQASRFATIAMIVAAVYAFQAVMVSQRVMRARWSGTNGGKWLPRKL